MSQNFTPNEMMTVAAAPAPVMPHAAVAAAPVAVTPAAPEDPAQHPGAVTSPMVGTIYLSAEPGATPFVAVGAQVAEGQTVLIIEAMKTMNHIPAPKSGTVKRILVEDVGGIFIEHEVIYQIWWPFLTGMHPDKTGNVIFRWLDIARYQMYIRNDVEEYRPTPA